MTAKETPDKTKQTDGATIKKVYTFRFYMMVLSVVSSVVGLVLFIIYFTTLNMALGLPGVIMSVVGIFAFRYYWKKESNITTEHIGGEKIDSANCLNIYADRVVFETMLKPEGFPMTCLNFNKRCHVNIWDKDAKELIPFVLPDQQYYDPIVFAQRVLGLPAHKRIFTRKPKLLQRLKTALLVVSIAIMWLLILTTTGN